MASSALSVSDSQVLGFEVAEDGAFWIAFLRSLKARGSLIDRRTVAALAPGTDTNNTGRNYTHLMGRHLRLGRRSWLTRRGTATGSPDDMESQQTDRLPVSANRRVRTGGVLCGDRTWRRVCCVRDACPPPAVQRRIRST